MTSLGTEIRDSVQMANPGGTLNGVVEVGSSPSALLSCALSGVLSS